MLTAGVSKTNDDGVVDENIFQRMTDLTKYLFKELKPDWQHNVLPGFHY